MANLQSDLYKALAESSLRLRHVKKIYQKSVSNIPATQQKLLLELQNLQKEIEESGLGANPEAEDRYLQLLEDIDNLDASYQMAGGAKSDESLRKSLAEEIDNRFILYGRWLLRVYGNGVLVKGAQGDLRKVASRLEKMSHPVAQGVAAELFALCGNLGGCHENR